MLGLPHQITVFKKFNNHNIKLSATGNRGNNGEIDGYMYVIGGRNCNLPTGLALIPSGDTKTRNWLISTRYKTWLSLDFLQYNPTTNIVWGLSSYWRSSYSENFFRNINSDQPVPSLTSTFTVPYTVRRW